MLPNSVRTRAVHFAHIFGPPRFVARGEAARIHANVCDALSCDDLSFQYRPSESPKQGTSKGFSVTIERREGSGGYRVLLDYQPGQMPGIRLLIEYVWPPSSTHVTERMDETVKAAFESLEGNWQKVLAEVRLRAQCDVQCHDAAQFIRQNLLRVDKASVDALGVPLSMAGVNLEVGEGPHEGDALASPKRVIQIEVLRDDPRCVYIELMSQWSQVPPAAGPGGRFKLDDLHRLRPFDSTPTAYVESAMDFLNNKVLRLGVEGGGDE